MTKNKSNTTARLSLVEIFELFPTDETAAQWFAEERWPEGVYCPHCGSFNVQSGARHKTMPYRCRDCGKRFSVRTKTSMDSSNLPLRLWAIAFYLVTTRKKGVSSYQLARDLGITQKSAWYMMHRIREGWAADTEPFSGPVEVDEAYLGANLRFVHADKKPRPRTTTGNKTTVLGVRDRATETYRARTVDDASRAVLYAWVMENTERAAKVYTDEHQNYKGMPRYHRSICHGTGQYRRGPVSTNGIEALWAMTKRTYRGTHHRWSPKHMDRYLNEVTGRHRFRNAGTLEQMATVFRRGRTLRYRSLIS